MANVPRRGSVIGMSRMTQPFQGKTGAISATQGSPRPRATLGFVTESLRDKGRDDSGTLAEVSRTNQPERASVRFSQNRFQTTDRTGR